VKQAEVVVIGGGSIGTSITYYLAKSGKNVVLVEKEDLASGSTGAGSGLLALQSKRPGVHLKLGEESIKLYSQLTKELDCDIEFEESGGMVVIERENQLAVYEKFVNEQKKAGINVKMLDAEQTRRLEPAISNSIAGVAYSPDDKLVNPLYVTFGFVNAAVKYGAKVYTHTEVTQIQTKGDQITSVLTNHGAIKTDTVVNAAGVNSRDIGMMVGVDMPITAVKGQQVISEPIPPILKSWLLTVEYIELKHRDSYEAFPAAVGGEQTMNGNVILGVSREPDVYNKKTTLAAIKAILRNWIQVIPIVKNVKVIRTFAGLRPESPDGLPIISTVDDIEGFIVATGHGGDGVALAPITGQLITALITDEKPCIPLEKFSLSRFNH
jgi:sarcosine oxidase subunit beta